MGSIDAACIYGFLCRLCSEMHRTVIHIYGDQGRKHRLAQKINDYLPVTITPHDPLPKTICKTCMTRVEQHHSLMQTLARNRSHFARLHNEVNATLLRRRDVSTGSVPQDDVLLQNDLNEEQNTMESTDEEPVTPTVTTSNSETQTPETTNTISTQTTNASETTSASHVLLNCTIYPSIDTSSTTIRDVNNEYLGNNPENPTNP